MHTNLAAVSLFIMTAIYPLRWDDTPQMSDERRCPRCGSVNVHEHGTVVSNVSEYVQYLCSDCGGYSRGRFTTNSKQKRKALLAT